MAEARTTSGGDPHELRERLRDLRGRLDELRGRL
jgi:hypothetical protein